MLNTYAQAGFPMLYLLGLFFSLRNFDSFLHIICLSQMLRFTQPFNEYCSVHNPRILSLSTEGMHASLRVFMVLFWWSVIDLKLTSASSLSEHIPSISIIIS